MAAVPKADRARAARARAVFARLAAVLASRPARWTLAALLFALFVRLLAEPRAALDLDYRAGDVARSTVAAPADIVYVDVERTSFKTNEVRKTVPPIFELRADAAGSARTRLERIAALAATASNAADLVRAARRETALELGPAAAAALLARPAPLLAADLAAIARARALLAVWDRPPAFFREYERSGVTVFDRGRERLARPLADANVLCLPADPAALAALAGAAYATGAGPNELGAYAALAAAVLEPDFAYDAERTAIRVAAVLAASEPVTRTLRAGEAVVRAGERIGPQQLELLRALAGRASGPGWPELAGLALVALGLVALGARQARRFAPEVPTSPASVAVLLGFFLFGNLALAILGARIAPAFPSLPLVLFLPLGISALGAAVLLGEGLAHLLVLASAYVALVVAGLDFVSLGALVAGGLLAASAAARAPRRTDLWRPAALYGAVLFAGALAHALLRGAAPGVLALAAAVAAGHALLVVVVATGLVPFFESLLRVPTRFKLLELADTDSPLLKRLLLEAPGTYTHSIIVGNMAETAAAAIGANAILARVGSYYHDIGKLELASYFIENQQGAENRHKDLKPSVSRSVLISHVKLGAELARAERLPRVVIDFIEQHHGTSLIRFFYHQALGNREQSVSREDFRYPGPRPGSKETAIVMLADSVEAASKTLKNPTPQRIGQLVTEIIRERFLEGELGESPLTLRDLTAISHSFVKILASLFHARIEYPDAGEVAGAERARRRTAAPRAARPGGVDG